MSGYKYGKIGSGSIDWNVRLPLIDLIKTHVVPRLMSIYMFNRPGIRDLIKKKRNVVDLTRDVQINVQDDLVRYKDKNYRESLDLEVEHVQWNINYKKIYPIEPDYNHEITIDTIMELLDRLFLQKEYLTKLVANYYTEENLEFDTWEYSKGQFVFYDEQAIKQDKKRRDYWILQGLYYYRDIQPVWEMFMMQNLIDVCCKLIYSYIDDHWGNVTIDSSFYDIYYFSVGGCDGYMPYSKQQQLFDTSRLERIILKGFDYNLFNIFQTVQQRYE